jgi:hypothetical protein
MSFIADLIALFVGENLEKCIEESCEFDLKGRRWVGRLREEVVALHLDTSNARQNKILSDFLRSEFVCTLLSRQFRCSTVHGITYAMRLYEGLMQRFSFRYGEAVKSNSSHLIRVIEILYCSELPLSRQIEGDSIENAWQSGVDAASDDVEPRRVVMDFAERVAKFELFDAQRRSDFDATMAKIEEAMARNERERAQALLDDSAIAHDTLFRRDKALFVAYVQFNAAAATLLGLVADVGRRNNLSVAFDRANPDSAIRFSAAMSSGSVMRCVVRLGFNASRHRLLRASYAVHHHLGGGGAGSSSSSSAEAADDSDGDIDSPSSTSSSNVVDVAELPDAVHDFFRALFTAVVMALHDAQLLRHQLPMVVFPSTQVRRTHATNRRTAHQLATRRVPTRHRIADIEQAPELDLAIASSDDDNDDVPEPPNRQHRPSTDSVADIAASTTPDVDDDDDQNDDQDGDQSNVLNDERAAALEKEAVERQAVERDAAEKEAAEAAKKEADEKAAAETAEKEAC